MTVKQQVKASVDKGQTANRRPGARFSKVAKLLEWHDSLYNFKMKKFRDTKYCSFLKFSFPSQHIKKPALQNKRVGVLQMAFWARKVFGTFEKEAPGTYKSVKVIASIRNSTKPHCL